MLASLIQMKKNHTTLPKLHAHLNIEIVLSKACKDPNLFVMVKGKSR